MIRSRFLLLLFLALLIFLSLKFTPFFRGDVIRLTNDLKKLFIEFVDYAKYNIDIYYKQASKIRELEAKIQEIEPMALLSVSFANQINHLLGETDLKYKHPSLSLVRTLSYQRVSDYNKLWLDFKGFKKDKIYGLIYKGYTAGIVKEQYGNPLAVLELDPDVVFSVQIGRYKTDGIIFGNYKNMVIKYIQKFNILKVGDEVVTSGKDGIFFEGLKVGKVEKIIERELYNEAIVKPYIKPSEARYFYAIDTNKN
jgi:rod shape-determining protein MreC